MLCLKDKSTVNHIGQKSAAALLSVDSNFQTCWTVDQREMDQLDVNTTTDNFVFVLVRTFTL